MPLANLKFASRFGISLSTTLKIILSIVLFFIFVAAVSQTGIQENKQSTPQDTTPSAQPTPQSPQLPTPGTLSVTEVQPTPINFNKLQSVPRIDGVYGLPFKTYFENALNCVRWEIAYPDPIQPALYNYAMKNKIPIINAIAQDNCLPISGGAPFPPLEKKFRVRIRDVTDWQEVPASPAPNSSEVRFNVPLVIPEDKLFGDTEKTYSIEFDLYSKFPDQPAEEQTDSRMINISTKDDFMWAFTASYNTVTNDYTLLVSSFITPQNPEIEKLLSEAKELMPNRALFGYQATDKEVLLQMKAIYNTIKKRGVSYVSTTISFQPGASQRIRLPAESLQYKMGNCIDGSVLFASAFEAIQLNPLIINVPGHSFVGVKSKDGTKAYFLETTMVGTNSFEEALTQGMQEYDNFNISNQITAIVDVAQTRQLGITPID